MLSSESARASLKDIWALTTQPDKQQPGSSTGCCLGSGEKVKTAFITINMFRECNIIWHYISILQNRAGLVTSYLCWHPVATESRSLSLSQLPHSCFIPSSCHHIRPPLCETCAAATFYPLSLPAPSLVSPGSGLGFLPPLFLSDQPAPSTQQIGRVRTLNLINTPDCVTLICQLISK